MAEAQQCTPQACPWLLADKPLANGTIEFCGGQLSGTANGTVYQFNVTDNGPEALNRQALYLQGIRINKCPCPSGVAFYSFVSSSRTSTDVGCTSVGGVQQSTLDALGSLVSEFQLAKDHGPNTVTVTGGSESGHAKSTDPAVPSYLTHNQGFKVDVVNGNRGNYDVSAFTQFVFDHFSSDRTRTDGCTAYGGMAGPELALENGLCDPQAASNPSPHWDLAFPLSSSSTLNLQFAGSGGGGITSEFLDCVANCSLLLTTFIHANLSAVPDANSVFARWEGIDSSRDAVNGTSTFVLVDTDRTISAVFDPLPSAPPGNPGCWIAASTGWNWNCTTAPPPGGGTPPTQGCWHWDPKAGSAGGWVYDTCGGNPPKRKPNPPIGIVGTINRSGDPNDKQGAQGAGSARYLSGNELLRYSVLFENLPTAGAPAATVVVKDTLDASALDLTTLRLGPVAFGTHVFAPPTIGLASLGTYTTNMDLRPTENLGLKIMVSLDISTGLLTWRLTTLDPSTGLPPADPLTGFLAIGEDASVTFSVAPKAGTATNSQLTNIATVVFDANAPIDTPVWSNAIDSTPPTSAVVSLPSVEPPAGFTVAWSGTDVGAGIQDFTIFVSDNGGSFTAWLTRTGATSATFTGQLGHSYAFYSVARDLVGNVEASKTTAESTTQVALVTDSTPPVTTAVALPTANAAGWNNTNVAVTLNSTDSEPGGTGVKQIQWSLTGAQTGSSTVPGGSTAVTISTEGTTTLTYFGTDDAGNQEVPKTLTIQIDKTPPSIAGSRSPAPNNNGWNNTKVTVSFTCSDSLAGLAPGSPPAPTALSMEGAGQSVGGTCKDVAGNSATSTVSGINIDKTPPVITASANPATLWPPNGKMVSVTVSGTMADNLSGINPSTAAFAVQDSYGLVQPSGPVSVASNGTYSFTISLEARHDGQDKNGRLYTIVVSAQDNAGNAGSATTTVVVPHDQGN